LNGNLECWTATLSTCQADEGVAMRYLMIQNLRPPPLGNTCIFWYLVPLNALDKV
jgi:hypothetical protein